ncbi:MAG: hypothetical protein Q8P67_17800 [archaeon]|nr:hypothetical protein [archaeon]
MPRGVQHAGAAAAALSRHQAPPVSSGRNSSHLPQPSHHVCSHNCRSL